MNSVIGYVDSQFLFDNISYDDSDVLSTTFNYEKSFVLSDYKVLITLSCYGEVYVAAYEVTAIDGIKWLGIYEN